MQLSQTSDVRFESYYSFLGRDNTRNSFYEFENDKYIIAAPIKLEIDWEPDKIIDVIDNITLNLNVDTFLMAVAISASCAFLTPIGHKNNTIIK